MRTSSAFIIVISNLVLALDIQGQSQFDDAKKIWQHQRDNLGTCEFVFVCEGTRYANKQLKLPEKKYARKRELILDYSTGKYQKTSWNANGSYDRQTFDGSKVMGYVNMIVGKEDLSKNVGTGEGNFKVCQFEQEYYPLFFAAGCLIFNINDSFYPGHMIWSLDKEACTMHRFNNNTILETPKDSTGHAIGFFQYVLNETGLPKGMKLYTFDNDSKRHLSHTISITYKRDKNILYPDTWQCAYYVNDNLFRKENWTVESFKRNTDLGNGYRIELNNGDTVEKFRLDDNFEYKPETREIEVFDVNNGKLISRNSESYSFVWYCIVAFVCALFALYFMYLFRKTKKQVES